MNNLLRKMLNRVYMNQADDVNAGGGGNDDLADFAAAFANDNAGDKTEDKSGDKADKTSQNNKKRQNRKKIGA